MRQRSGWKIMKMKQKNVTLLNEFITKFPIKKKKTETMMNTKVDKTVDKITHHVSLRQIIYT